MDDGRRIFTENEHGILVPMRVAAPPSEDELQHLIARFPEIVSEDDSDLLLIRREQGVPGEEDGSDRWSLDHLFVTRSAVPVLIEVKRASDTRLRREVVGQILDYAANGAAFWEKGTLKAAFDKTCEESGEDPDLVLSEFLEDYDAMEFWDQVAANLEAGRIKLVIAADSIPSELALVVEFLNEQMRAEVRAIELRYFQGGDGRRTLVPRIIGETERTRATKSSMGSGKRGPISVEDWFEEYISSLGDNTKAGARCYLELIAKLGGRFYIPQTQGSLISEFDCEDGEKVFPFALLKSGRISIQFGTVCARPQFIDEVRRKEFYDSFNEAVGPLSNRKLNGYPSFLATQLADHARREAYAKVAANFVELAIAGGPKPPGG